jgi:hypothetical protein
VQCSYQSRPTLHLYGGRMQEGMSKAIHPFIHPAQASSSSMLMIVRIKNRNGIAIGCTIISSKEPSLRVQSGLVVSSSYQKPGDPPIALPSLDLLE